MSPVPGTRLPLAILVSGRGTNMQAIARACASGAIAAEVRLVVADRPESAGLALAAAEGLPTALVPYREHADRAGFEAALARAIDASGARLVVLAGFMRILTSAFTARYAGRLLNIHPSLLPRHPGLDTHRRALEAGDAEAGASVHFVTEELDGGPVVLQSRVRIEPGDTAEALAERVLAQEYLLYPRVIGWIAAGRLRLLEGRPVLDGRALGAPLELAGAPA